ncbi:MAG: transporter substrate-binding domain-containing protein, partial [Rhodospirillaceae bacterium]|nr:transporter substrate-binding domain-containing protein [Rhodospirillaceae bacterium]
MKLNFYPWIRQTLAIIACAMAVVSFNAPQSDAAELENLNLTTEEQQWLAENPTIRVHNETDWPPFNFFEDGKPQGFSIDYMNLLAEKIGLRVEFVTGPSWSEFLDLMKSGDLDVMLNIVKTPERQKYMLYTKSYMRNPNTILSRRETPYDSLEQLFGKTVALPKGFFYDEILKRDFPRIKLHLVTDVKESMKAVIFGKADAALGELAVFNYILDREMMTGLVLSGEVEMGNPEFALLNIATRKDLPHLISILRKAMATIKPAEVKALRQRWIGGVQNDATTQGLKILLNASERAWLADHQIIRLGVDPVYPPFEFVDKNGVYSGMASDYVRLISERLNIKMEVLPDLTWQQVMLGIREKTIDVLPAVSRTDDRATWMNFTAAHIDFPFVIITRDDHPFVGGLDDFIYNDIALVEGYGSADLVRVAYPNIFEVPVATPLEALKAVAVGDVDATVLNLAVATYLIKQNNLHNLKVAAPTDFNQTGLAFGVRKDWPELVGILEKALGSITQEEEIAIRNRWATV